MRKFKMQMPDVQLGELSSRPIKNSNKETVGERHYIDLLYLGGFVRVEVDRQYYNELKPGSIGTATIEMEPVMSARQVREYAFLDSGFQNFRIVGFDSKK